MAMVVKNNMSAVRTLNTLNTNSAALQKSLAKVSSGMKINSAQDDASGYAISERMRVQIRSLDQANQNTQNASSLMKTAEGAVSSTVEILKSLKEKAINAATDTNTDSDRATIQKELDQFIDQIDDNALTTFNGKYLVDGSKSQEGQAVATAMTNQSLASNTKKDSILTELKNRNNESLEIAENDFVTASYVMNGSTYTTKFTVGSNRLEDIFTKLNEVKGPESSKSVDNTAGTSEKTPDELFADVEAKADEIGSDITNDTDYAGLSDEDKQLITDWTTSLKTKDAAGEVHNSTFADYVTAQGATFAGNGTANMKDEAAVDALVAAKETELAGATTAYNAVGVDEDMKAALQVINGQTDSTNYDAIIAAGANTSGLSDAAKELANALIKVGQTNVDGLATKAGDDLEKELNTTIAAEGGTRVAAAAYQGETSAADATILTATAADTTKLDADESAAFASDIRTAIDNDAATDISKIKDVKLGKGASATVAKESATGDNSGVAFATVSTADYVTAQKGKAAAAVAIAQGAEAYKAAADDGGDTTGVPGNGFKGITSENTYIGKSTANNDVNTADDTNGITVTANNPGLGGQISGLSISITDSEGNVKKSANAALDAFKTTIYAKNKSANNEMTFHTGASANQAITVGLDDMRSEALGLKGRDGKTKVSVATQDKANAAVSVFDNAIQKVLDQQATIGAVESRLEYTSQNLTTSSENVQAAESTIRDADMAKEMTTYTKNNVLLQAAQSMLAQANQNSSAVLSLLQ